MIAKLHALACLLISVSALTSPKQQSPHRLLSTQLFQGDGTGGWGIGSSRELTPEEFATRGGSRKAFDGYQMQQRADFLRQINDDKEAIKKAQLEELLGVAKIAGINVKDPKERLNKFEEDVFPQEEDDDLDVSV